MKDALERIEADVKEVKADLKEVKAELAKQGKILAVNTSDVATHIKRTDIIEAHVQGIPQKLLVLIGIVGGLIGIASHFIK